ncbi:hypothetical protein OG562_38525 [Streptomyces sp. NBC_01275]|uniref:hypothetical protein n=1 Tax=Streptomyces sp. NBC_01275 TaxID=2903807 RepID=UPI00225BF90C|nr:hypothetical protein [Streptomyces sp. NBC_01275]MCX4766764.1 hypothetical protein [Streptomyces sp. NBC_01275]
MVSVARTAHNIEITAESLQEDLARLQVQKQALERELAAVVAHLGSVQRALSALEVLMLNPAAASAEPQTDSASAEPTDTTAKAAARRRKPQGGKGAARPVAAGSDTHGQKAYGQLTEQIMAYFAEVGDVDVRARDVAAALGRDTDSGSINGIRSTLDRMVGASRVQRTGRGLYRAKRQGGAVGAPTL